MPADEIATATAAEPATAAAQGTCLLLASGGLQMLVPRNMVAEVLSPSFLKFGRDSRSGLGTFEWRGYPVLHLSGEMLGATGTVMLDEDARVVIFHGLKNPQRLPYYSLTLSRSPRLLRVGDGDLEEITGADLHPAELMRIRVENSEAFIPRVDYLENVILGLMQRQDEG